MKQILNVVIFIVLFISCGATGLKCNKPSPEKVCDFVIPDGYKLKKNVVGLWGIEVGNSGLLGFKTKTGKWVIFDDYVDISSCTSTDTCIVKGYLKLYLESLN